jgi:hypothetical protein
MNLKRVLKKPGIRMLSLISLLTVLFFSVSSCQQENLRPSHLNRYRTSKPTTTTTTPTTTPPPVVVTSNGTYKISAPISLTGVSNLTISGDSIEGGTVPCITLTNCTNIHINHCKLFNSTTTGVNLSNCVNISVDSSYISNVSSGVYATNCQTIQVVGNQMKNMMGPFPRGQFVQFNTCSGAGNSVINNKLENIMGSSNPEDAISMYMTNGTAASPVIISGNWIRGGGPSTSGGGIMLGDSGGSYQVAENNILVNPGQYGMAVSGGNNMQVLNNQIYAVKNTFTNVGIYVYNQATTGCSVIIVSGNIVNWTNSAGVSNPSWDDGNCGTISGWSNNTWGAAITSSILPAVITSL